jgi:Ca2+-binding RTX toxin-like protein
MRRRIIPLLLLLALAGPAASHLDADAEKKAPTCFGRKATIRAIGAATVFGTAEDDVIVGDSEANTIDVSQGGVDRVCGGGSGDAILGQNFVTGETTERLLASGGDGDDVFRGSAGDDVLLGGAGGDELFSAEGDDRVDGGGGNDVLDGLSGEDTLDGEPGDDQLFGKDGGDDLFGGSAVDRLQGGEGFDVLAGGKGADACQQDDDDEIDLC